MDWDAVRAGNHAKKIKANNQPFWPKKVGQRRIYYMALTPLYEIETIFFLEWYSGTAGNHREVDLILPPLVVNHRAGYFLFLVELAIQWDSIII